MRARGMVFGALVLMAATLWAGMPAKLEPGSRVPEFSLNDVNGKSHSLKEYLSGKYAVIMFIATRCPVSNAYNERMVALARDYASRGVAFVGINSNKQESVEEVKEHAKSHGFTFAVLKDPGNEVADAYGAQVTPEIFLVDADGVLRYHGRIDDSRDQESVTSQDLRLALDALLGGKQVPRAETKSFGCSIKRVER